MSEDKKSCENCLNRKHNGDCKTPKQANGNFSCWQRNPSLWLSIPPDTKDFNDKVEIWMFWRRKSTKPWTIIKVGYFDQICAYLYGRWTEVSKLSGQWQGPITPHEGAR